MSYKKIAIITGANSGFGKEFLKLLINEEEITEIWAVARNKARLNQLVDEFGSKVKIFSKDLRKCMYKIPYKQCWFCKILFIQ